SEFMPEDQIIPFTESTIRVFGRVGERNNRNKARFKFVIQKLGLEEVMRMIEEESLAVKCKTYKVDWNDVLPVAVPDYQGIRAVEITDALAFEIWKETNVYEQKQRGYVSVSVTVATGDLSTEKARILVEGIRRYAAVEIRISQNRG